MTVYVTDDALRLMDARVREESLADHDFVAGEVELHTNTELTKMVHQLHQRDPCPPRPNGRRRVRNRWQHCGWLKPLTAVPRESKR